MANQSYIYQSNQALVNKAILFSRCYKGEKLGLLSGELGHGSLVTFLGLKGIKMMVRNIMAGKNIMNILFILCHDYTFHLDLNSLGGMRQYIVYSFLLFTSNDYVNILKATTGVRF